MSRGGSIQSCREKASVRAEPKTHSGDSSQTMGCLGRFGLKLLILLTANLLQVPCVSGADFGEDWRWVLFDEEHGLPSTHINSLLQSSDGTMWAATTRGLAYYDGFDWHRVDEIEPASASTRGYPDARGGLLVVAGGSVYRGGRAGFSALTLPVLASRFEIESVAETADRLLLSTNECRVFEVRDEGYQELPRLSEMTGSRNSCSLVSSGGKIWLKGTPGLFELTGEKSWTRRTQYSVSLLLEDGENHIAVSVGHPGNEGLFSVPAQGQASLLPGEGSHLVTAADVGSAGQVIVANTSGGINLRQDGRWSQLEQIPLALRSVRRFRYQKNGDLWVAAPNGLYLHKTSVRRWEQWRVPVDDAMAQQINSFAVVGNGDVLAATGRGVLRVANDGTRSFFGDAAGISLKAVTGIAEDRNGDLWISSGGSFSGAIRLRDGTGRRFGAAEGLADARFHRIRSDRSGNIWFLGHSVPDEPIPGNVGTFRFDGMEFTRWGPQQGVPNSPVYDFHESEQGSLWFATVGGLARWTNGNWTYWTVREGLRDDRVFSLAIDDAGIVWFGHQQGSAGLGFIDATDEVDYIDTQDGLPSDNIWDLAHRPGGGLWMTSDRGLILMRDRNFTDFGLSDGLAHPRLWAIHHTSDSVLVGSVGGGVYRLFLEEGDHPAPKIIPRPAAIDGGSAVLRWDTFAYRGEIPPSDVFVRYRLDDREWSGWNRNREASFLNLNPGVHSLEIQSRSLFGNVGTSVKTAPFTIAAPFYQHPIFLGAVSFWTISLISVGLVFWRKQREHQQILERKVSERTALLQSANRQLFTANLELEAFSYSVSHDLRAPLRSIAGFSQILEEDYRLQLDSTGLEHLERIRRASVRMAQLIDNLLELSRVSRIEIEPREVNLSQIANETASRLHRSDLDRKAQFRIPPGLTVNGDAQLLRVAVENLMENAWKYTRLRNRTEISLGFDRQKQAFYLRDNGIGFDMDHSSKLFQPFERLSSAEDFEGTGIGLATVSRIIVRHGGRIWAESQPDAGSTFYFTVPESPDRETEG